jgi:putative DNA primase/helicase
MRAEAISKALGARKAGGGWMARCPAHVDREPSLSIRGGHDGKVLVHCHAGCAQKSVIAVLRSLGLWDENGERQRLFARPVPSASPNHQACRDDKRSELALAIWQSATPSERTLVEIYLISRGLRFPTPLTLRFRAALRHPSGGIWPAMVALVTRGVDNVPLAIHRTFLARDGTKAPVDPQKMMLGHCRGGAVRLAAPGDVLMVGEGIETCLAAMLATGHPAWAALSTSGLRALDLPDAVRDVIVLADGDDPGEAAARDCAWRWKREGRRVRIARPPQGMDFNDLLVDPAPRLEDGAR